jgi:hypothetical protein
MTEEAERDRVDAIARTWLRTPFHDHGEVKGAGVDCATLLKCVFLEAGLIEPFEIGYYSPQFFLHQSEERYLGWVRKFAHEIPLEHVKHGDVVLYKAGKCFSHAALIVKPGWPSIIHAHFGARCVRRGFGTSVHLGIPILDVKFFSKWQR